MQSKLLLISAALLGSSACAHGQSAEMDAPSSETTTAKVMATESAAVSTSGAQDGVTPSATVATASEVSKTLAPPPQQEPGDSLVKPEPTPVANAAEAQALPTGAEDHPPVEGEPLARFVLTRGIEDREPVDEGVSFKPGERVYAFLEVANPDGGEYALNLRWARDEGDLGEATALTIGASPRWRTWSWRRAPEQPGSYRCFIETQDGEQVAEIPFRVES